MAAKAEKKKPMMGKMAAIDVPEMPTMLHIDLNKFDVGDGYGVGDKCTFAVSGKITGMREDKYGKEMTVEVSKINEDTQGDDNADAEDQKE